MKIQTFYFLVAIVSTTLATVVDVQNDIQNITNQAISLNNQITNYPATGSPVSSATALNNATVSLGQAIDKGTSDAKALTETLSASDGLSILNSVKVLGPTILSALSQVVTQKPAIVRDQGLASVPLVLKDLKNLNSSTSQFEDALTAITPATLLSQAAPVRSSIDTAFADAIAGYS